MEKDIEISCLGEMTLIFLGTMVQFQVVCITVIGIKQGCL